RPETDDRRFGPAVGGISVTEFSRPGLPGVIIESGSAPGGGLVGSIIEVLPDGTFGNKREWHRGLGEGDGQVGGGFEGSIGCTQAQGVSAKRGESRGGDRLIGVGKGHRARPVKLAPTRTECARRVWKAIIGGRTCEGNRYRHVRDGE